MMCTDRGRGVVRWEKVCSYEKIVLNTQSPVKMVQIQKRDLMTCLGAHGSHGRCLEMKTALEGSWYFLVKSLLGIFGHQSVPVLFYPQALHPAWQDTHG